MLTCILCEELTHWKRLWCWEGLGAGGEGDDRGWDGWMASLTQWKWVWVDSGSCWWTGRPGALRFMGSQRVGHDLATELNLTEYYMMRMSYSLTIYPMMGIWLVFCLGIFKIKLLWTFVWFSCEQKSSFPWDRLLMVLLMAIWPLYSLRNCHIVFKSVWTKQPPQQQCMSYSGFLSPASIRCCHCFSF